MSEREIETSRAGDLPATSQTAAVEFAVTQAPVTQAPVTQAPVTQAPVTQAPVTQAPVTQAPVTQSRQVMALGVLELREERALVEREQVSAGSVTVRRDLLVRTETVVVELAARGAGDRDPVRRPRRVFR